ncbi:hypothetical protein GHT06_012298 [Daphnia sinensis]|uniref:Uncharacterized protein n=1 Tax=Daphnia sinensis TaxID=1820382 RepID=A0AAD5KVM8_9CRUS|nr:hypothetical protein GHT06_012298 [Daphnia sinensis]
MEQGKNQDKKILSHTLCKTTPVYKKAEFYFHNHHTLFTRFLKSSVEQYSRMSPILMLMLLVAVTAAFPYPQDAAVPADVVAPVEGGPAPGEEKVDERFFLRPSYGGHGHGHGYGHHHHHGYGNHYNGYGGYGGYSGHGGYGNHGGHGLYWREGQKAGEGTPDAAAAVPIDAPAAAAAPANGQVTFE